MKKKYVNLAKLDLYTMVHESVIELFVPILFFLFPIISNNFSLSFIRIIILFIPIGCLGIMLKGFTFSFFMNYVKTLDLLLIYFSVKYLVISSMISIIMTLVFSCLTSIQIVNTFFSLIFVSIVILSGYFLLLFYFLKTAEPELVSGAILFVLGNITFYATYFIFDKIGYWSIAFMIFTLILYFKAIVPFFKTIMLRRFEIIMEKIL